MTQNNNSFRFQNEISYLKYVKLSTNAYDPIKSSSGAAGFDLRSAEDVIIPCKGRALVPTDLQFKLPPGTYGRIAPRSGLAFHQFVHVAAGVCDPDYTGGYRVLLYNYNDHDYVVEKGNRIAQLICEKYCSPVLLQVQSLEEEDTERGNGSFGSTGTV